MTTDNIKIFNAKELQDSIGKWYSVPLSDETITKNGKVERTFFVSKGSSLLTAEYIIALLRNFNKIVKLPPDVQSHVMQDNNIQVWYSLYAINSDCLTDQVATKIQGSKQENASGKAGNISKSYFTPYYNQVCLSAMTALGVDAKSKILSTYQIDALKKMSAYLIMDGDSDNIGIPLNGKTKEELDLLIDKYVSDGYNPVRLLFEDLPPEQSNLFNIKPISDIVANEVDGQIEKYFMDKSMDTKKLSAYELKNEYGINLSDAFSNKLSNQRFWCTFKPNGELNEVYVIPQKQLYFGFTKKLDSGFHFESRSFVKKPLNKKDGVISLPAKNKLGEVYDVEIVDVDLYRIMEKNNYGDLRDINTGRPKDFKVELYDYLIIKNAKNIKEAIKKAIKTSQIESDNEDDLAITATLKLMCEQPDTCFNLIKHGVKNSSNEDIRIVYKNRENSGITYELEERYSKVIQKNDGQSMHYVCLHKNNLAYEREKVLTALFVEHAIKYLKKQGHTNIKIEFEKSVKKNDGSIGYLDLILTSALNGEKYGQVFEFKAWSVFSEDAQQKLKSQCDDYDIQHIIDARAITKTYTGSPVNLVKGINLQLHEIQTITDDNVPWCTGNRWPVLKKEKPNIKKSIKRQPASEMPKPFKQEKMDSSTNLGFNM